MEVNVTLDETLVSFFSKYGGFPLGHTIEQELRGYHLLYQTTLSEIKGMFTEDEVTLIADACTGYCYEPISPKEELFIKVQEDIEIDRMDEKWGVDKQAILEKLASLSQFQAHTVLHTISKCWDRYGNTCDDSFSTFLKKSFQKSDAMHGFSDRAMISGYSIKSAIGKEVGNVS